MKFKIILSIIALCLLSLVGFSQRHHMDTIWVNTDPTDTGKSWVPVNDTHSTTMNIAPTADTSQVTVREVYTDVKNVLSGIGSALKVGSEHVYSILIKQQFVKGVTYSFSLLAAIVSITLLIKFVKFAKKSKDWDWRDDNTWFVAILLAIVSLFSVFFFVASLETIITAFVNPEYGALQDILTLLHKKE